jgi:hypothetical protein
LTLNEPFLTEAIDDFGGRGVNQPLSLAQLLVELPHGGHAEFPELCQDGVFQIIGRQTKLLHATILRRLS